MHTSEMFHDAPARSTSELIEFRTVLTAGEIARGFRVGPRGCVERACSSAAIDPSSNPFDEFEDLATFGVAASYDAIVSSWGVQLFIFDHGDYRDARLVVLGTTGTRPHVRERQDDILASSWARRTPPGWSTH